MGANDPLNIDIISIFPEYFTSLDVSLLGRAREAGLVNINVHNLRQWAQDNHKSVDDAPYGGGAGMVMSPDIWGRGLDEVLSVSLSDHSESTEDQRVDKKLPSRILAIPTPSGTLLTQRRVEQLLEADQIVIACGRYEGIDQRVADYYRDCELEVLEYSIGDYVLAGGEVAALVLVEALSRLIDGVMGNPESLVEESHATSGLLEYPVYTRPQTWRHMGVPDILLSGDHKAIARWRHDQSLIRTAHRRPDLINVLDTKALSSQDREVLAGAGKVLVPRRRNITIRLACPGDASSISELAAQTFPAACPDYLSQEAIDSFIEEHLSVSEFSRMLLRPDEYRILVVEVDDTEQLIGYTLTVLSGPDSMPTEMVRPGKLEAGAAYLSKCYLSEQWLGSGIAGALLERAVVDVEEYGTNSQIALGTNIGNKRAQAFYRRHGFKVAGRRTFHVGDVANIDDMFVRNITPKIS